MVVSFVGDGVVEVFGAVLPQRHHAERAVAAALNLRRRIEAQRAGLQREERLGLEVGIGLHSGPMSAGIIEMDGRLGYTTLGDTVNVAASSDSEARGFPITLHLSERTRQEGSRSLPVKLIGQVALRGRREPILLWCARLKDLGASCEAPVGAPGST